MAERRMFAKTIIDSDAFIDMPVTARLLYYDLSMRADDDGFVNSPKKIMRMIGAADDDLRILAARKFIIPFDNGVVVIKHWRIHNYIRKDTYNETPYKEQKSQLELDENNSYRLIVNGPSTERLLIGDESSTQVRIGKDRLGEVSEGHIRSSERHKYGEYQNVLLTDEQLEKLKTEFPDDYETRIQELSAYMRSTGKTYKDHLATIRNWARMEKQRVRQRRSADEEKQARRIEEFFARHKEDA